MLQIPSNGQNILEWARKATHEINANHIQNGIGINVTRTPNGTNLVVHPGEDNATTSEYMPFAVSLKEWDGSVLKLTFKAGKVFYVAGDTLIAVPNHDDGDEIEVTTEGVIGKDDLWLGIILSYGSEGDEQVPESFSLGNIPKPDDTSGDGWVTADGVKYYPLVNIIKRTGDGQYKGAYVASFAAEDGEGETQSKEYHYIIQSHHGNVWLTGTSGDEAFVAELTANGGINGFFGNIVNGLDTSSGSVTVHITELALTATLPSGARCIAHPIPVAGAAAGSTTED